MPVRTLRRQLKHGQLFWREVGRRGQVIVFLHGSWHDGDQWSDVLSLVGQNYHCLAPDLLGFGESGRLKDRSAYSISLQVNTLAELLESLRLESVVLVGHSLGAWVAARYALQHPQQVRGLCVLEPEGVEYEPKRWRRLRWLASPLGGLWLGVTKGMLRSQPQKNRWLQRHHLRQLLRRYPAACRLLFRRRRSALEAEMVGGPLAGLAMASVVLQGEGTEATSQGLAQKFMMSTPGATIKVLPGNDELPSYEPQAIADFLDYWCAGATTDQLA